MARNRILQIRLDDAEYNLLAKKGAAVGGMSKLLRDHLGKIQVRHRDDERQRIAMLNRLNANLNMIARWCNVHQSQADAVQIMVCLADVRREIARLLVSMER
jgi:predicted amino acid dehydrogenase